MSVIIRDSHKKDGTIGIVGLWVFTSPTGEVKLGADIGENIHCINYVEVDDNGDVFLSRTSFGGTYVPLNGLSSRLVSEGWKVERKPYYNVLDIRDAIYTTSHANIAIRKQRIA
jgi:hypothetical protein